MITTPTLEALARAIDVSALRQSVYAANIANAGVTGYQRMEVNFDRELERINLQMAGTTATTATDTPFVNTDTSIVSTGVAVKLDEEMGHMAKNALRYQVLLSAFEKSIGTLRFAIREGRG